MCIAVPMKLRPKLVCSAAGLLRHRGLRPLVSGAEVCPEVQGKEFCLFSASPVPPMMCRSIGDGGKGKGHKVESKNLHFPPE